MYNKIFVVHFDLCVAGKWVFEVLDDTFLVLILSFFLLRSLIVFRQNKCFYYYWSSLFSHIFFCLLRFFSVCHSIGEIADNLKTNYSKQISEIKCVHIKLLWQMVTKTTSERFLCSFFIIMYVICIIQLNTIWCSSRFATQKLLQLKCDVFLVFERTKYGRNTWTRTQKTRWKSNKCNIIYLLNIHLTNGNIIFSKKAFLCMCARCSCHCSCCRYCCCCCYCNSFAIAYVAAAAAFHSCQPKWQYSIFPYVKNKYCNVITCAIF